MALRPWVTPQEVQNWTERKGVKNRSAERLKVDIFRAENYVIAHTRNRFDNAEKYPTIPEAVRIAVMLLAEQFATTAAEISSSASAGVFKSEKFDDYCVTSEFSKFLMGQNLENRRAARGLDNRSAWVRTPFAQ